MALLYQLLDNLKKSLNARISVCFDADQFWIKWTHENYFFGVKFCNFCLIPASISSLLQWSRHQCTAQFTSLLLTDCCLLFLSFVFPSIFPSSSFLLLCFWRQNQIFLVITATDCVAIVFKVFFLSTGFSSFFFF